jgi:hypothetical protein
MEIPKDIKEEIWDFCRLNDITNINEFTIKLLKQGFTVEKFGSTPTVKIVDKIVEKIVEVEVEKIVEKIIEIPINIVDSEIDDKIKDYIQQIEDFKTKLFEITDLNSNLQKELEIEKNKNKKDIYGER